MVIQQTLRLILGLKSFYFSSNFVESKKNFCCTLVDFLPETFELEKYTIQTVFHIYVHSKRCEICIY